MESDRNYFMRRAAQERSAASTAQGKARIAHQDLAKRYRNLVDTSDVPLDEATPPA